MGAGWITEGCLQNLPAPKAKRAGLSHWCNSILTQVYWGCGAHMTSHQPLYINIQHQHLRSRLVNFKFCSWPLSTHEVPVVVSALSMRSFFTYVDFLKNLANVYCTTVCIISL